MSTTQPPQRLSAGECPVGRDVQAKAATQGKAAAQLSASDCPVVGHGYTKREDVPEPEEKTKNNDALPNVCPAHWQKIPSHEMRGNSDDGQAWENPSPRQLYAAVRTPTIPSLCWINVAATISLSRFFSLS
jgi:hypothetical protein